MLDRSDDSTRSRGLRASVAASLARIRRARPYKVALGAVAAVAASAVAVAFPWDVDMADGQMVRGYECWQIQWAADGTQKCLMWATVPVEGTVSQPNLLTPNAHAFAWDDREDVRWEAMEAPFGPEAPMASHRAATALELGKAMYDVYCTPCHGDGTNLGQVASRWPMIPPLAGKGGRASMFPDGHIYRVIRKGRGLMPAYGWAMNDDEIWSVVHYVRTLPDATYLPPAPPAPVEGSP